MLVMLGRLKAPWGFSGGVCLCTCTCMHLATLIPRPHREESLFLLPCGLGTRVVFSYSGYRQWWTKVVFLFHRRLIRTRSCTFLWAHLKCRTVNSSKKCKRFVAFPSLHLLSHPPHSYSWLLLLFCAPYGKNVCSQLHFGLVHNHKVYSKKRRKEIG